VDLWDRSKEKNKRGMCAVKRCRQKREKQRTLCRRCRQRVDVINNPVSNAYRNLKSHAKQRGIPFDLTRLQFEEFCLMTGYAFENRGKTKTSFSIDRIRSWEGYHPDNIQVLTLSENTRKEYATKHLQLNEDPF
jgi:hypothetical protein